MYTDIIDSVVEACCKDPRFVVKRNGISYHIFYSTKSGRASHRKDAGWDLFVDTRFFVDPERFGYDSYRPLVYNDHISLVLG